MSSDSRSRIAQVLAGSPAAFDSQGLQQPAIDPIMLMSMAAGPGIANALAGLPQKAPQLLANEAGAIFPEGMNMAIPQEPALAKELGAIVQPAQQNYLRNKAIADWHASNSDWPRVLQDKWALLAHSGGN